MKDAFEKYLVLLRQDRDDKTEHSDRGALETFLNAAAHAADPTIRIIHEAKKVRDFGAPDLAQAGALHGPSDCSGSKALRQAQEADGEPS